MHHPSSEVVTSCKLTHLKTSDCKLSFLKLLDILSNEEYSEIISWLPHGNGFLIHKKKAFANEILPKHFKASKFTSFTRKLNRWGFSRAPRGPETGAYFHKLFCRDKPEMVLQMTSNSGNKYQNSTQGGPLLPAVPMMMGATPGAMPAMPFYMPPPQMAMLTPQQQQTLWQQQMQLYQFQQMQMFQFQQQQQAAGTNGTPPAMPPQMMMMMPHPMMPMPTAALATTPDSSTKKVKKEAGDAADKEEGEEGEDYHDAVDDGIDADEDNKVGV
jgi:HSF-type DNA-binding